MQDLVLDNGRRKSPKVLPMLRVTIRTRMRSSDSSASPSSSSSSSSSFYKRRKLNNCLWVDDDKGNPDWGHKKMEEKRKERNKKNKGNKLWWSNLYRILKNILLEGFEGKIDSVMQITLCIYVWTRVWWVWRLINFFLVGFAIEYILMALQIPKGGGFVYLNNFVWES